MASNYFPAANDLLHQQFRYRLHPDHADSFRARLQQIGWQRFLQAMKLTQAETATDPQERHCLLEMHMYQLRPARRASRPLRNPQANLARAMSRDMDARVAELVADPRQ